MSTGVDVEFAQPLSAQLKCPICHDLLRHPQITRPCSHSFCQQCILRALETDPTCPICRERLDLKDLHTNLALAGLIDELIVVCQYRSFGCQEKVEFQHKTAHESRCPFAPTSCPHAFHGCRFQGNSAIVKKHVESECIFEHMKAFIERTENQIAMLTKELQKQKDELFDLKYSLSHNSGVKVDDQKPPDADSTAANSAWYQRELQCRRTLNCHSGVTSLEYMEEINWLFSGGHDGSTKVWDLRLDQPVRSLVNNTDKLKTVWALAYDKHRENLYTGSSDGLIRIWNLNDTETDGKGPLLLQGHISRINAMMIMNDSLFSVSSDNTIKAWSLENGECTATFSGHSNGVNSIVNLPSGNHFATGSNDRTVKIWNTETQQCERTIEVGPSEVLSVRAGDGLLFTAGNDSNILVYNLNDHRRDPICRLTGHAWEVWQLAYAGGGVLFSGSFDHKIKRWDIRNQKCTATLEDHKGFVHALTLGPDQIISGCADRTIKLWGPEPEHEHEGTA